MKPKTIILMVVAIVCGLGASYMTSRLLAERESDQAPPPEIPKVTFLVAKKNLDSQTLIRKAEDMFTEKTTAKDDAPAGALTDLKALKGKFLRNKLRAGDHVTDGDLLDGAASIPIPDGMVGIGIRIGIDGGASGFATVPGSRVDVVWSAVRGGDDKTFARILLQDVLVVAADTTAINPNDGQARPASVITVALNREQALRLRLASQKGEISLLLRRYGDQTVIETEKVTVKDLDEGSLEAKGHKSGDGNDKTAAVGGTGSNVKVPTIKGEKPAPPVDVEPQRFFHKVTYVSNGKRYTQMIEVDGDNNPVAEGGQQPSETPRIEAPAVLPAPSAPAKQEPQAPAKRGTAGDSKNTEVKS